MAKTLSIQACRHGHDGQLKFILSIRTEKKGDLSDFEHGMVVGVRQACFHKEEDNGLKNENYSIRCSFLGINTDQRRMARVVEGDRKATVT